MKIQDDLGECSPQQENSDYQYVSENNRSRTSIAATSPAVRESPPISRAQKSPKSLELDWVPDFCITSDLIVSTESSRSPTRYRKEPPENAATCIMRTSRFCAHGSESCNTERQSKSVIYSKRFVTEIGKEKMQNIHLDFNPDDPSNHFMVVA